MGLFKDVKKPVIKSAAPSGGEISPLRPNYVAKLPPCAGGCPCGTDIRGWLTTVAQADAYGRTTDEAYQLAWEKIADRNPVPIGVRSAFARIRARTAAIAARKTAL